MLPENTTPSKQSHHPDIIVSFKQKKKCQLTIKKGLSRSLHFFGGLDQINPLY
jgi:hypothetical protein